MALLVILFIVFELIPGFFTRGQTLRRLGRVLIIAAVAPVLIGIGKNLFRSEERRVGKEV